MKTRFLYVNQLKTDESYQSPVNESQVNKITKNFNPDFLHTIVVAQRENGDLYILDGQHRVVALKRIGFKEVEAVVHTRMSMEEEAEMYRMLNERPTKSPNAKAKAELQAGYPVAIAIDSCVKGQELEVDYDKEKLAERKIGAYSTLKRIYKKFGEENLSLTLHLIKFSFGTKSKYFSAVMMEGVSKFIAIYKDKIDTDKLIHRMQSTGFEKFVNKCSKYESSFSKKECPPLVMVDIYNYRRRKEFQLDKNLLFI